MFTAYSLIQSALYELHIVMKSELSLKIMLKKGLSLKGN